MNVKITRVHWDPPIPDDAKPGIYWNAANLQLYIITPDGEGALDLVTQWGMPREFEDVLHSDTTFGDPTAHLVADGHIQPEIRGLFADDLKELIAVGHEAAAVALIKRG